jgi:hypothetical protein
MIYAQQIGIKPIDWKTRIMGPQISQHAEDAGNWGTWPEAHIDYQTERSFDGYPLDEMMYSLNVLFAVAVRDNNKDMASLLLKLIEIRALQLTSAEEMALLAS